MSRKRSAGRTSSQSQSHIRNKNEKIVAVKIDNLRHQTVALFKTASIFLVFLYFMSGTLAMGIIYHQHKGHLFNWLAGDESIYQKQAAIKQRKAAEEAELEAECQASYHMSCTGYALSIAEATQSNGMHDSKQVAMLEKLKNKARAM